MDTLLQQKLQLQGDIKNLERKQKDLINDISRIQKQKELTYREYSGEIGELKENKFTLAKENFQTNRQLVARKAQSEEIVENSTNFSQVKVDQTKLLVDSMIEDAQRRMQIAEQKEKAVLGAFKRLTASENTISDKILFIQEQQVLLTVARQEIDEDKMKVKAKSREVFALSQKINQEKTFAASMFKEAESKLKEANELWTNYTKQTSRQQNIIKKEKKLVDALKKSYEEKEKLLKIKEQELSNKQIWLEDKENTLKRGFEELKKNG